MMKIIERIKKWVQAKKEKSLRDDANSIYQLREYEGELWITLNGNLGLPVAFLNGEPIQVLNQLREAFVERNLK